MVKIYTLLMFYTNVSINSVSSSNIFVHLYFVFYE